MGIIITTFSSSILSTHGVYPAAKASFAPFAFVATVRKNVWEAFVFAMIQNRNRSTGSFFLLCLEKSVLPNDFLLLFFFLEAHPSEIAKCQKNQQHVPVPAGPRSTLMVIQSQLFFQLLVAMLNPESFMENPSDLKRRHILRHVAKKVTQFGLAIFKLSLFNNQPYFLMPATLPITVSRPDPTRHRFNHQRLSFTVWSQFQSLPAIFFHFLTQLGNLYRFRICLDQARVLARSSWFLFLRLRRLKHRRLDKHLRSRIDSHYIVFAALHQSLAKLGYIPIPRVRHHGAMWHPILAGKVNLFQSDFPFFSIPGRIRHPRLFTHRQTFWIVHMIPRFGNEQIHSIRPRHSLPYVSQADPYLAIINFASCSAVLPAK